MGLDMYWYRETYKVASVEEQEEVRTHDGVLIPKQNLGVISSSTSTDQVGYLRKANAVHGWIVRKLAHGRDECQRIYMDRDDVASLLEDLRTALATGEGMEPVSGFFFGSLEKDEYWRKDLERAAAICRWMLNDMEQGEAGASYFYQASW